MKKTKKQGNPENPEIPESMITRGLVVNCSLPSRSILQDGIRKQEGEVRYAEIIDLFPQEIFTELETIRRFFYRKLEGMVLPAYSIKLLPFDELPKFKQVIEKTKAALIVLDAKVEAALQSAYHKKATKFFKKTSNGHKPRTFTELSKRMQVSMMPLRLDPFVWQQFLTEEMQNQEARIKARYTAQKERLDADLKQTREAYRTALKDLQKANEDLDTAYETQTVPLNLATMKIELKEIKDRIKDLTYQEKDLKRKLNRLNQNRERETSSRREAYVWATERTEETEKAIAFDVKKLWADQLEDLVRRSLEAYEVPKQLNTRLQKILKAAEELQERIITVKPGSVLVNKLINFINIISLGLEGKAIKEKLEVFM